MRVLKTRLGQIFAVTLGLTVALTSTAFADHSFEFSPENTLDQQMRYNQQEQQQPTLFRPVPIDEGFQRQSPGVIQMESSVKPGNSAGSSFGILLEEAQAAYRMGQFERSGILASQVLKSQPENIDALMIRGGSNFYQGNFYKAVRDGNKILMFQPNSYKALNLRGVGHLYLNHLEQAKSDCQASLKIQGTNPMAYAICGLASLKEGDVNQAEYFNDQALTLSPELPAGLFVRSAIEAKRGEFKDAISDANRALQLSPYMYGAYIVRGFANYGQQNLQGAEADAKQSIKYFPESPYAHELMGQVRKAQGQVEPSVDHFETAIQLYIKQGQPQKAAQLEHYINDLIER